MESFEELFIISEGSPIVYKDQTLFLGDRLQVQEGDRFGIVFEEFNSNWRQGIRLIVPTGSIVVQGLGSAKGIVLWQDTAPEKVEIGIQLKSVRPADLVIYNVWHTGRGGIQHGHNGAAMRKEELADGSIRYWCNDGYPDDDLDDIVFRMKKLEPVPKKDKNSGWRRVLKLARSH